MGLAAERACLASHVHRTDFEQNLRFLLVILSKIVESGVHPHRKRAVAVGSVGLLRYSRRATLRVRDLFWGRFEVEDVLTRLNWNSFYKLS